MCLFSATDNYYKKLLASTVDGETSKVLFQKLKSYDRPEYYTFNKKDLNAVSELFSVITVKKDEQVSVNHMRGLSIRTCCV